MYPLSASTGDQIPDRHPSLGVKQRGLVQRQPYSLRPAQNYQMTGSGNLRGETTLAERKIKTIISREGWAASLGAAVIAAGATTRAVVNSLTGRITSQDSRARPPAPREERGPRQPPRFTPCFATSREGCQQTGTA